jgi:transposase-like protein
MGRKKGAGFISEKVKAMVIHDYHYEGNSRYALAKRYGISPHSVDKILREYPKDYKAEEKAQKQSLNDRSDLPSYSRKELLEKDAVSIIELSFQAINTILKDRGEKLTPSQLSSIISVAAPYVMTKPEKGKKGEQKENARDVLMNILKGNQKMRDGDSS